MSQEPTDQELVIRLKAGDLTALAALDRRYRVRIIRLIAPLAKSYEEAEDIYQEAIFKAASHIECFDHRWKKGGLTRSRPFCWVNATCP